MERSLSWKELWGTDQGKLPFLLWAVANLKVWGQVEEPSCKRCGTAVCTLNHILTGFPNSLGEGRYRRRHDKVLMEIAKWTELQRVKAVTSLRPDMTLASKSTKTILIAELTVPWEDRLAISHQLKKAKCQNLIDEPLVKG